MNGYKSEIRDGDIEALQERVAKAGYHRYLRRIILKRLRGFAEREVVFEFPVTAIVGPNGGGKTTILGAAGLIYKGVTPRRFFAKSGKYDASMKNWAIEYELVDKELNPRLPIQRTASYKTAKWNRKAEEREVLIFGVERTLPATERPALVKAMGGSFTAAKEIELDSSVTRNVGAILGKDIDGHSSLLVDADGRASLFAGSTQDGDQYSEFHFGAGEASVIRIVSQIEDASDSSLILIEEIENGLHPIATRNLVDYLIDVARRKSCQVIFTTHSNDALAPLPSSAIWAAYRGDVLQGKLDVRSLRTITGQVNAELAVFVEDEFAEQMVKTALRHRTAAVDVDTIEIHAVGGAGPAKKVNEQHNLDPTRAFDSVCLLDGDQKTLQDANKRIFVLPGSLAPDAHVFSCIASRIDEVAALLAVAMHLPPGDQQRVADVVKTRKLTNRDRHVVYEQIGVDLGFLSGTTVAGAFLSVWAQVCPEEVDGIVEIVSSSATP